MISRDFAEKLKASFEALDARISALEVAVNETLIEGLRAAAEEYEDDVKFSEFSDRNQGAFDKYSEPAKILYGDDFDVPSAVYEEVKASEGYGSDDFDEAGKVSEILKVIDDKIEALQGLKEEVKDDPEKAEEISEDQLAKEFAEYKE